MRKLFHAVASMLLLCAAAWPACVLAADVSLQMMVRAEGPPVLEQNEALLDAFERLHPGLSVTQTNVASTVEYPERIKVQIAAGTAPDLIYLHYSMFPGFAADDLLLDLTPYIERDAYDLSQFFPAAFDQFDAGDGRRLAVPRETSSIVLFYNEDAFNNAGVSLPDDEWTYESMASAARRLAIRDADTLRQAGMRPPLAYWQRRQVVWSWGGAILNPDHTDYILHQGPGVEAYQFIADMISAGYADWGHAFTRGQAAMEFGGFWYINALLDSTFDWGVALLPSGPAGRAVRMASGGWAIPAASEHPDEAWELLKFVNSKEALAQLGAIGNIIPARRDAALSQEFLQSLPPGGEVFIASLEYGHVDPVIIRFDELNAVMTAALNPVWAGEVPARVALTEVEPQVEALLTAR